MGHSMETIYKETIRASEIIGTHVANWEGENCGRIEEVMVHKNFGEIAYLVLSYPGHFGEDYAEKRFAVPFESFQNKQITDRHSEYILNVDEEFLKKAPGFNRLNWPDFADPRFITELKDYYKGITLDIEA